MTTASLETTDIFRGAFYLCMGGDLRNIQFRANGKQIATFYFNGKDLHKHDNAYIKGSAMVNPVQFREALNHLRDVLFKQIREQEGRYENDKKRKNRVHQKQY